MRFPAGRFHVKHLLIAVAVAAVTMAIMRVASLAFEEATDATYWWPNSGLLLPGTGRRPVR